MRKVLILPIFFLLFVGFHSQVHAQTATPAPHLRAQLHQEVKDFKQDVRKSTATPSGFNQKLCDAHVKVAKLREASMGKRASNMKLRLDKISTLVETYYTTKLVPQGKTVSNYDSLVADVSAKKAALSPLIDKVQADSGVLTCEGGKATGQFQTFRTDAASLIAAFKAYRQSVINLIQGVRSAAGTASISPELTPEVTQ